MTRTSEGPESPVSFTGVLQSDGPKASPTQSTNVVRYRLFDQLVAVGEDFYVQTDDGKRAYKINGNAIRTRDTLRFEDLSGRMLCEFRPRLAGVRDAIFVTGASGERLVTVRRQQVSALRDLFTVQLGGSPAMVIIGDVAAHEFEVSGHDGPVALVSKRWFRARGSYGVEIAPWQDEVYLLAAMVALDQMIAARAN